MVRLVIVWDRWHGFASMGRIKGSG